jgi:hypothetical protein
MKFSFKLLLLAVIPVIALTSCSPDDEIFNGSPAAQIIESEKLVIPDAVALPDDHQGSNVRVATYFAKGVQK